MKHSIFCIKPEKLPTLKEKRSVGIWQESERAGKALHLKSLR